MNPVFEGFLDAFAACGVFFGGLIYLLELWAVLTDHGMQVFFSSSMADVADGPWHASTFYARIKAISSRSGIMPVSEPCIDS